MYLPNVCCIFLFFLPKWHKNGVKILSELIMSHKMITTTVVCEINNNALNELNKNLVINQLLFHFTNSTDYIVS